MGFIFDTKVSIAPVTRMIILLTDGITELLLASLSKDQMGSLEGPLGKRIGGFQYNNEV